MLLSRQPHEVRFRKAYFTPAGIFWWKRTISSKLHAQENFEEMHSSGNFSMAEIFQWQKCFRGGKVKPMSTFRGEKFRAMFSRRLELSISRLPPFNRHYAQRYRCRIIKKSRSRTKIPPGAEKLESLSLVIKSCFSGACSIFDARAISCKLLLILNTYI